MGNTVKQNTFMFCVQGTNINELINKVNNTLKEQATFRIKDISHNVMYDNHSQTGVYHYILIAFEKFI